MSSREGTFELTDNIRTATPSDLEPIKAIAVATELFAADEVAMFDEMFGGSLDGSLEGHSWLVLEDETGAVGGAAYYAPEPFSDRLWNLYFLGVSPALQGTGGGTELVGAVENGLAAMGNQRARILLVETSGLPSFETTRRFYRGAGLRRRSAHPGVLWPRRRQGRLRKPIVTD